MVIDHWSMLLTKNVAFQANMASANVRKTGWAEDRKINPFLCRLLHKEENTKSLHTKKKKRNVIQGVCREVLMNYSLSDPDLSPCKKQTNAIPGIVAIQSHLFGSLVFLLSWRPSMMEKELAGNTSLLSSSYRQ